MNNFEFLGPLVFIAAAGAVILAVIAVVQDLRQDRKYGYRQAFFTIISLTMLVLLVGSTASFFTSGLKASLLQPSPIQLKGTPPALYLTSTSPTVPTAVTYTCATDCQFTAADRQAFDSWKTTYQTWVTTKPDTTQNQRDLVASLSLLILSLPLYLVFTRLASKGAAEEIKDHHRPSPLRSVYFYGAAFAGLVLSVVFGAILINTGLQSAFKTTPKATSAISVPAKGIGPISDTSGVDSVISCAEKCGLSAADVALAQEWKIDTQEAINGTTTTTRNDVASSLPWVVLGIPIFWYHFVRIRKETQTQNPTLV